jgi:hypothetical protein
MRKTFHDVSFHWQRPKQGHEWDKGLRLKPRSPETEEVLDVVLVMAFRKFTSIDTGGNRKLLGNIPSFADTYGDIIALPGQEHPTGETWCNAIQQMRRAVNLWDRLRDPKVSGEARRRVQRALNLETHRALTDTALPSHTAIGLTPELGLALCPVNLLAYMWLAFARVVSGEIQERPCMGNCGGYIYVGRGPGLKREDSVTCSDACRKWKERQTA